MFDELRDVLRTFADRPDPDERRRMTHGMREALIHAKLGISGLRQGLVETERKLAAEQAELDTVRRRQGYAADIGDQETVAIAERFAQQHADRVAVLESKRMVQQQELALAEREYESMSTELRRVMSGLSPQASSPEREAAREVDALLNEDGLGTGASMGAEGMTGSDEGPTRRTRAEREADAEARLAEMKRRFGK
jgi:hypothetical protein